MGTKRRGSFLPSSICTFPPLLIRHSAPSFRSLSLICIDLHNTTHLHSRRLVVGARKKGEEGGGEKRGEILFSSKCVWSGGKWQEEDRNKNSHYFLSSLLPSLPSWTQMPERCQGAGFSVLFCLASSGLGSPAWPPTLLGSGFRRKEAGVGGEAVGTESGEGRHLR